MESAQSLWRSEVIDTDDRFFALQDEWRCFQNSFEDPHSSPFLSWDWLYLWWQTYRRPFWSLAVGVIRYDNRIVAIFPFYIKTLFIRRLYFIGTGELECEEVASEYLDCLIEKNNFEAYTRSLEWLHGFLPSVDMLVFERMLVSADLLSILPKTDFPCCMSPEYGARYKLDLRSGLDIVTDRFDSNLKRRYRKYRKRLLSVDNSIRVECCGDAAQLDDYFSDLKKLHEIRWQSKGKLGAFSSKNFRRFHRLYAQSLLSRGGLYFLRVYVDGVLAACLYMFDACSVRYFYQAGFESDMQHLAPGHLSHFVAIENAVEQGYAEYDFMLGVSQGSYKAQYVAQGEKLVGYFAARYKWQMIFRRIASKLQLWF